MYFKVIKKQFPDELIAAITWNKAQCSYHVGLTFVSNEDAEGLSAKSLAKFSAFIQEQFPGKQVLDFEGSDSLSDETVKLFLKDKNFVQQLNDYEFLKLLVRSDEIASFALTNSQVQARLNAREAKSDTQTFPSSCAARCLMRVLLDHKLLEEKNYTRVEELRIYQQIWEEPGKPACPDKMVKFLQARQLAVEGVAIEERAQRFVAESSGYEQAFNFFKTAVGKKLIQVKEKELKEEAFTLGVSTLLVEESDVGLHLVLAKRLAQGRFEVTDPYKGNREQYASFASYCEKREKFVGIALNMSAAKPA